MTGTFGLMGLYIGDGKVALCRQIARDLEREPARADVFVRAYTASRPPRPGFAARLPVYVLEERLAIWEWAQR